MEQLAFKIWSCAFTDVGIFVVSNFGDVYFARYRRSPSTHSDKDGYITFTCKAPIGSDNKTRRFMIHRLVAMAFIPNPENKPQINHKNGVRNDNRLVNIEWATAKEDAWHRFNVNKFKPKSGWQHKLSKPVSQYDKDLNHIADYGGASEAARLTNGNQASITACCNGKCHSSGGYFWAYIGEPTDRFIGRKPITFKKTK